MSHCLFVFVREKMKVTFLLLGVVTVLSSVSGFTLRREKRTVDFITGQLINIYKSIIFNNQLVN